MTHCQHEDFLLLVDALGGRPYESLSHAALRVFRQNCAPRPLLDVSRILLELQPNAPTDEQWQTIQRAARVLRAARRN